MLASKKGTGSSRSRFVYVFFLAVVLLGGLTTGVAADSEDSADSASLDAKVRRIEARLLKMEADQTMMLEKLEEILKELHTLKIWVRRS